MHDHSEFYQLFNSYFWLIFPIGFAAIAMLGTYLHHRRAQRALAVIEACAIQGKEAPAEVVAMIQPRRRDRDPIERAQNFTLVSFILIAAAGGFTVLALAQGKAAESGLFFVASLAAGLSAAFFAVAMIVRRDAERLNKP